jgi:hypothetical protein
LAEQLRANGGTEERCAARLIGQRDDGAYAWDACCVADREFDEIEFPVETTEPPESFSDRDPLRNIRTATLAVRFDDAGHRPPGSPRWRHRRET